MEKNDDDEHAALRARRASSLQLSDDLGVPHHFMDDSKYEMAQSDRRVRRRLAGGMDEANLMADDVEHAPTSIQLSGHVLAIIFGYLPLHNIMRSRCVCRDWKEAAKGAFVTSEIQVTNIDDFETLEMMTTALPNLQHLEINDLMLRSEETRDDDGWHGYMIGDDPYARARPEEAASTTNMTRDYVITHDVEIVSNFQHLLSLSIVDAPLNGRYPNLFRFSRLQELTINDEYNIKNYIKWDLEMLEALPTLKKLTCFWNVCLTGNLSSLRALQDTLEEVKICGCRNVEGKFMELADFPRLKHLALTSTPITGDIRDIGENDFKVLVGLFLPHTVYGGYGYRFQSIAEASDFMIRIYPLAKRFPLMNMSWKLSNESPDWYFEPDDYHQAAPPLVCELVKLKWYSGPYYIRQFSRQDYVRLDYEITLGRSPMQKIIKRKGTRFGWRWRSKFPLYNVWCRGENEPANNYLRDDVENEACEINWLEPEPEIQGSDLENYNRQLRFLRNETNYFSGFYNPPTEDEFNQLYDAYLQADY